MVTYISLSLLRIGQPWFPYLGQIGSEIIKSVGLLPLLTLLCCAFLSGGLFCFLLQGAQQCDTFWVSLCDESEHSVSSYHHAAILLRYSSYTKSLHRSRVVALTCHPSALKEEVELLHQTVHHSETLSQNEWINHSVLKM